jgi:hypothetical protein
MWHILRIGLPIGLQFGLEVWAFQLATLLAGRLGTVPLAAHTIVLNLSSFSFMFPLGISMAASVRVGNLVGQGDLCAARRSALLALALGLALGAAPRPIPGRPVVGPGHRSGGSGHWTADVDPAPRNLCRHSHDNLTSFWAAAGTKLIHAADI